VFKSGRPSQPSVRHHGNDADVNGLASRLGVSVTKQGAPSAPDRASGSENCGRHHAAGAAPGAQKSTTNGKSLRSMCLGNWRGQFRSHGREKGLMDCQHSGAARCVQRDKVDSLAVRTHDVQAIAIKNPWGPTNLIQDPRGASPRWRNREAMERRSAASAIEHREHRCLGC